MCNFQIYALRVQLAGFLGAKISSMCLVPSLRVNTARRVITFGTRQYKALSSKNEWPLFDLVTSDCQSL